MRLRPALVERLAPGVVVPAARADIRACLGALHDVAFGAHGTQRLRTRWSIVHDRPKAGVDVRHVRVFLSAFLMDDGSSRRKCRRFPIIRASRPIPGSMAAQTVSFDVAVVGTGVVGLAAALGCAQRGVRLGLTGPAPRLRVPTAQVPFDPRIYALAGASIQLLEDGRAWPQVDRARIQPVVRMQIEGDAGGSLSFDAYSAAVDRLATIVEESELLRALWMACGFSPALAHLDDSFQMLDPGADSVRVGLAGGRAIEPRLVLGADGRGSTVRAAAGFNVIETPYRQTAVVANFACAEPHRGAAHQFFTDAGGVV